MNTNSLTRKELANRWNCSVETIKRKEKAGYLVPFRLGKRFLRYRLVDIEEIEKTELAAADLPPGIKLAFENSKQSCNQ